jgi:hypothetical protein
LHRDEKKPQAHGLLIKAWSMEETFCFAFQGYSFNLFVLMPSFSSVYFKKQG